MILGLTAFAAHPQAATQVPDQGDAPQAATGIAREMSHGVGLVDGALHGAGPDYKATFSRGGLDFTPALGSQAPRNFPFGFRLDSVGRGSATSQVANPSAVPTLDGRRVTYAHAPGFEERYDVLPEGVHQTFMLATPPTGSGDLVVRGRIDTDLTFSGPTDDGGLLFALDGVGGVRYGGVTGVDALGRTVAGELRLDGDMLELVLPSAFVESAAYPLLVDPLIGSDISVAGSGTWSDGDPDVAFDAGENRYLVVWERRFSLSDIDIRGQLLSSDGSFFGGLLFIEDSAALTNSPSVATVRQNNVFFVAWQEAASPLSVPHIAGRSVTVGGTLSSPITVSAAANVQLNPDVGGEKTLNDDDAFVVWEEANVGIRGAQVTVPPSGGLPNVIGSYTIASEVSQPLTNAAITKSAGDAGRFVVVWQSDASSTDSVWAQAITRNGTLLGAPKSISFFISGFSDNKVPDVDGDGTRFLCVWQREEGISSGVNDIYCRSFVYENGELELAFSIEAVENDADDDETAPAVIYTGEQFVVAYTDRDSNDNIYVKILDPYTCDICTDEVQAAGTGEHEHSVALASMYHGGWAGGSFDDTLVVWESFGTESDVLGHLFESPAGVDDLGGGCGAGGTAVAVCPYSGNENFRPRLLEAAPLAPVFLAFGFDQAPFGCGPCTIWPSLGTAVVLATTTDAAGEASILTPLPGGLGNEVFTLQWATPMGDTCSLFGVDLSNGIELQIQDL